MREGSITLGDLADNVAHIINPKKPKYVVHRYLYKNNMLKCNRKFEDFEDVKLIRESNGYFHFIAKCNTIFTATLKNN